MREITHGDIRAAARVLLARPRGQWPAVMAQMLDDTHHADRYRKAFGRVHPRLGNGTLMAVALAQAPAPEPPASDCRYLAAIAEVIEAVLDRRARHQPRARQGRRRGGIGEIPDHKGNDETPFPAAPARLYARPWHKHRSFNSPQYR